METDKKSQLIASLREGIAIVQMICFKELRSQVNNRHADKETQIRAKLTGTIVNEIFGTPNQEPEFVKFRKKNWGTIEQELLSVRTNLSSSLSILTDSLRIQVLCDQQEGTDSGATLINAKNYGFLLDEREIPLPSTYMALIRIIGEKHNLIIAPVQISPTEDEALIQ